jgi:aromatic ring-opening dioxygenase catalytic subunit (LigB family)
MARLIGAAACSHAFAVEDPVGWDERRQRNRENFKKRFGELPPEQATLESDDEFRARYRRFEEGLTHIRTRLAELRPDVIVMVGDDQDECFTDGNFPQVAVYLGGDFTARGVDRTKPRPTRAAPALARSIYEAGVEGDVDVMSFETLPDGHLPAHAFGPVLDVIDPEGQFPVVPVFINAIHYPGPSAGRSYRVGEVVAEGIRRHGPDARVVVGASGGLSHYPATYPAGFFGDGQAFPWGWIDEEFDRWVVDRMRAGDGAALKNVSALDLLKHGDLELRSWIAVVGAVGTTRPEMLVYEPLYRGITGMGAAFWSLDGSAA